MITDELRENLKKELKPHILQCKPTGKKLGSGAYGKVIEITKSGSSELFAGKIFKSMPSSELTEDHYTKLKSEIQILLTLRHENVVHCEGVCFIPNSLLPVVVMEKLNTSLHSYVLNKGNHHMEEKVSILLDVVCGLQYLHSRTPVIIHRDLTAKNVLLDSKQRAKLSDFGYATIMEIDIFKQEKNASEVKTDILKFGHLILFTVLEKEIRPLKPHTYLNSANKICNRSEKERRETFVEEAERNILPQETFVLDMINKCLSTPEERPDAAQLQLELTQRKNEMSCEFAILLHESTCA